MTWLINIVRNKAIDALRSGKTSARPPGARRGGDGVAADARQQPQALLERSLEKLRITGAWRARRSAAPGLALAYYPAWCTEIAETLGGRSARSRAG